MGSNLQIDINGGQENSQTMVRVTSLSDMLQQFFEEGDPPHQSFVLEEEEEDNDQTENSIENAAFWESQHQLLKTSLCRTSSLELKIRREIEKVLRELRSSSDATCSCSKGVAGECRSCTLTAVGDRLRSAGYDCAICKTKWRSSQSIPSGEHKFLDVIDTSNTKRSPLRILIELNFRVEFEMARASKDYTNLVQSLPEFFVGKPEKLRGAIKVLCAAAKMCMKNNKMHLAPWRKHKYMQAKWLSPSSQRFTTMSLPENRVSSTEKKSMQSMLSFDMVERMSGFRYTVVEVL